MNYEYKFMITIKKLNINNFLNKILNLKENSQPKLQSIIYFLITLISYV